MASISIPLHSLNYTPIPPLPSSLANSFKICDVQVPDLNEATRILFAIRNFNNASSLADSLTMFCRAYEEVFMTAPVPACSHSSSGDSVALNLQWLEMVISLSQKHMREFYGVGALASDDSEPLLAAGGEGLHVPSMVYSEISESTRASWKDRFSSNNDTEDNSQQKAHQKKCLEEFSVVLALKDSILCSVLPGGRDHSVIIKLMRDVFPSCDIEGLLVHEGNVREGMAVKAKQDRGAGESARESRAASVMQTMQEQCYSFDGQLQRMF